MPVTGFPRVYLRVARCTIWRAFLNMLPRVRPNRFSQFLKYMSSGDLLLSILDLPWYQNNGWLYDFLYISVLLTYLWCGWCNNMPCLSRWTDKLVLILESDKLLSNQKNFVYFWPLVSGGSLRCIGNVKIYFYIIMFAIIEVFMVCCTPAVLRVPGVPLRKFIFGYDLALTDI